MESWEYLACIHNAHGLRLIELTLGHGKIYLYDAVGMGDLYEENATGFGQTSRIASYVDEEPFGNGYSNTNGEGWTAHQGKWI